MTERWRTRVRGAAAPLVFLSVAAVLTCAGWLRPPLSDDIDGVHLPLGVWSTERPPAAMLQESPPVPADSAGVLLLVLMAGGAVLAAARPARTGAVAGVVLAVAIAANAAAALNHPALIERLDSERDQRQQVVQVLRYSPDADPLSTPTNGRIGAGAAALPADGLWVDVIRPWEYLLYGPWLVVWAALGVWFGTRAAWTTRWRRVAAWTAAGVLLGTGLCFTRLRAEVHWTAAQQHERRGEIDASRERVRAAMRVFPEVERLERTWLLLGKLDRLEGKETPAATLFRAVQLAAIRSSDDTVQQARAAERLSRAVGILDPLLGRGADPTGVARAITARVLTSAGIAFYVRAPRFTDAGLDYSEQQQHVIAAQDAWQRALQLDPDRLDDRIYLTYTQGFLDPARAGRAESGIRLADRLLRADVLNMLADAHFKAGLMNQARRRYAESLDLANLPQRKNFRAQKGLGGL